MNAVETLTVTTTIKSGKLSGVMRPSRKYVSNLPGNHVSGPVWADKHPLREYRKKCLIPFPPIFLNLFFQLRSIWSRE